MNEAQNILQLALCSCCGCKSISNVRLIAEAMQHMLTKHADMNAHVSQTLIPLEVRP